ncbi:L-threonylcarbamoyladenylate synthase [Columbia Basin potato purple top phytoplasma]|uniref:L-threonylcarbamoyladenylate synthase n=1 Tax=Columbia Basin potato purple top phytoplasma TaxID=307134 RepID=A0ABT5L7U8_9MOLU|nr:L-threonylcarbamoyladenylate synthase [Columbia Basin potato purple top phytoplasma]MDC9031792.1 threonylcarbamoyl-AMP synthase [Columbia Basin potato purple top phytoplasma]
MLKHKIIIFPTDTVYGLGCSIYDKESLKTIYNIKQRDFNKPISILCSSLEQIEEIAIIDEKIKKLISYFWPGPLTIIVFSKKKYFDRTNEKKIGIRIPNHPLALEILKIKGPLKTTSVNKSGEPPLNNYLEIIKQFKHKVDYIYPNNPIPTINLSSTVIDATLFNLTLVREGCISFAKINKIIN